MSIAAFPFEPDERDCQSGACAEGMDLEALAEGDPALHVRNVRAYGRGTTNDPQILREGLNPVLDGRRVFGGLLASHVVAECGQRRLND